MKGIIRPAKEMKYNINDEIKVGDIETFKVNGHMKAVEVVRINDGGTLKVMSCDLTTVWERVDRSTWQKQVEFMKQITPTA